MDPVRRFSRTLDEILFVRVCSLIRKDTGGGICYVLNLIKWQSACILMNLWGSVGIYCLFGILKNFSPSSVSERTAVTFRLLSADLLYL